MSIDRKVFLKLIKDLERPVDINSHMDSELINDRFAARLNLLSRALAFILLATHTTDESFIKELRG